MSWFEPPLRKDKPSSPVLSLSLPKRKGMAALVVGVPTFVGLVVGVLAALFLRWLGGVIQGGFGGLVTRTWVAALIVAWFGIVGAYVGWRSLVAVLMYGALESEGKISLETPVNDQ